MQSDSSWTTPGFEVNSTEPLIDIGVDGEGCGCPRRYGSARYSCARIRTPAHAPGVKPAAGVAKASIALVRVLAGHPAR